MSGSSFSIEPESGKIYLHRVDPVAVLDLNSFSAMLEKFVNMLEQWRKTLVDFRPVAEAIKKEDDAAGAVPDFGLGGFMQV